MGRRVLVVTYFFPPMGGVGVQRTLQFIRHLPGSGWQPTVVATRGAAYRVTDDAQVRTLAPDLEVHRAVCVEPAGIRATARSVAGLFRGRSRDGPARGPGDPPAVGPGPGSSPRRWLNEAWRAWVATCFVPDEQMAWIPSAALTARGVHRRHNVEVIYSSAPPASAHLAAGLAKSLTGLPWVADFRDPWVGNTFAPARSPLRRRAEAWLERWVIGKADRVIFATPSLKARYEARYPRRARRFVTIPNGYDREELGPPPTPSTARSAGPFRLVYTGSVYGEHELRIFLDGLAIAVQRDPSLHERLRVEFVGWMSVPNHQLAMKSRGRLPLTVEGFVPRTESMRRLRDADAALLLLADGPDRDLFVGAKLFEYIGLDRQILAMAPLGDTRRILAELDWGIVCDPTPAAVADALGRVITTIPPARSVDRDGRFDRAQLAARLAEVLGEASGKARTRRD